MQRSSASLGLLMAIVLAATFTAAYAIWGHPLLLRPFWMDELHSWLLITDPDPRHAFNALKHGADYNPPVFYAVARAFTFAIPLNEHNLRVLSLLLTVGTATGVAVICARRMNWYSAIGCGLLLCSQELVILQSTEVRFYALWLCLLTWFCVLLTTPQRTNSFLQIGGLCLLAAMTAGTHYFGIISIGIVCVANSVAQKFTKPAFLRSAAPLLAASLTVAACLPILFGQKQTMTVSTWVKPATLQSSVAYLQNFISADLLMVTLCIWLVGILMGSQRPFSKKLQSEANEDPNPSLQSANPLPVDLIVTGSLLLMPVVLIVFSFVVQPALVNRYSIAASLWLVPVLCIFAKASDAKKGLLVLLAGCALFAVAVRHGSGTWEHGLKRSRALVNDLKDVPANGIVLFEDRIDFWLLQHQHPSPNWFQLDFETDSDPELSDLRIVQRDIGRTIQFSYPKPFPMKSLENCQDDIVYVVPYAKEPPQNVFQNAGRVTEPLNGTIQKATLTKSP